MGNNFISIAYHRFLLAAREEMTPVSTNFLTLDFLRFFSSLIVIMLHYNQEIATDNIKYFFENLLSHSRLFVDLFFVISGFIISYVYFGKISSQKQYGHFLIKRVARLWPLHIILLLTYLAILGATNLADIPLRNPDKYDLSCIIPHALMIHSMGTCNTTAFNYVSWSISAEMAMYVLIPLFFLIAARSVTGIILSSVAVSAFLIWLTWGELEYLKETTSIGFARAIPSFLFGIFVYRVREKLDFIPFPQVFLWVVMGTFFFLSYIFPDLSHYAFIGLIYAMAVLAVSADMHYAVPSLIKKLAPMGNLTYGSYMIHPLISTVIFAFLAQHVMGLTGLPNDLTIFVMIPLSFIAAVFSLVLIETPCRRFISKFVKRKF